MRQPSYWPGVVVATVGLVLAATTTAAPAHAAGPNDLEISLDGGTTWSATATGQLFDGIHLFVPGDSVDDQFLLRNVGDTAGALRITLRNVTYSDPVFAGVLSVRVDTLGFPGTSVLLADASPCAVLSSGQLLAPGQQILVDAHAELGSLTGSDGQGAAADFVIRAALHEVGAIPQAPTFCDLQGADVPTQPPNNPGQIAFTGAEIPLPLVIGGAALLGIGLFFVVAARRKRAERDDESPNT